MVIRVELADDAVADLARYAASGNLPLFLQTRRARKTSRGRTAIKTRNVTVK
jgi:hypothetical protein